MDVHLASHAPAGTLYEFRCTLYTATVWVMKLKKGDADMASTHHARKFTHTTELTYFTNASTIPQQLRRGDIWSCLHFLPVYSTAHSTEPHGRVYSHLC